MDLVELASALISFRTEVPPGNEEACARYIGDVLSDLHLEGSEVRLEEFGPGRANLVAKLGPREPGLLLGGHIDVVPVGDESAWSSPPFQATAKAGRLYGRGAADMKTGLAAILMAVGAAAKRGRLRRGITVVATGGEEVGFDGLKSLIRTGVLTKGSAKFGVLGEPTGLRPVRGHKGGATFRVTFFGRSGHASRPELGINAVEKCAEFVDALAVWTRQMARFKDPDLGCTIATPTVVRGGTKSNVIPGTCELTVDTRWIPGHGTAFVAKGLKSVVAGLKKKDKEFDARVELLYDTYSLKLPSTHPLVRLAESLSGKSSETAPYGTEAALYTKSGIPSLVFGPGGIKQAHIVDEFVELSEARRAVSIYSKMIESVCGA